jgi:hypothetical protein
MENTPVDRHLELRLGHVRRLGTELLVPVGAELRAPDALRSDAAAISWADDKSGELSDAERSGALIERKFHEKKGSDFLLADKDKSRRLGDEVPAGR